MGVVERLGAATTAVDIVIDAEILRYCICADLVLLGEFSDKNIVHILALR